MFPLHIYIFFIFCGCACVSVVMMHWTRKSDKRHHVTEPMHIRANHLSHVFFFFPYVSGLWQDICLSLIKNTENERYKRNKQANSKRQFINKTGVQNILAFTSVPCLCFPIIKILYNCTKHNHSLKRVIGNHTYHQGCFV